MKCVLLLLFFLFIFLCFKLILYEKLDLSRGAAWNNLVEALQTVTPLYLWHVLKPETTK